MESQPFVNPQIFAATDAIVAAFLAIGFAAAFTFERRLNAVAWWAGGYALLSLYFVVTGFRYPEPTSSVLVLSWVAMLGASSLFLGGVVQVQSEARPRRLIAATAAVSIPIIVAFPILGAPLIVWEAVSHGLPRLSRALPATQFCRVKNGSYGTSFWRAGFSGSRRF